jgi:integrase
MDGGTAMARSLKEAPLTTPNARLKLTRGIHWRSIAPDIHLGYRRGVRGGTWLVRWYLGDQKYRHEAIGVADDVMKADGENVLDFYQAERKAKKVVVNYRLKAKASAEGAPPTVRIAIEKYLEKKDRDSRNKGGTGRTDIRNTLKKHTLSKEDFAATPLYLLKEKDLKEWHSELPSTLANASKTRISSTLKAALNYAARTWRETLPAEFPLIIKNGLAAEKPSPPVARHDQAYPDEAVQRLVLAANEVDREGGWEGDLHRLIVVLAATGARLSQINRMKVGDVQIDRLRLMVPVSNKGKGEKTTTHVAFPVGQDVIDVLLPVVVGRGPDEILLERWYMRQISNVNGIPTWTKAERAGWRSSSQLKGAWPRIVEKSEVGGKPIPYSFRHSSIVRMLGRGLPTRLVAALHDTSTKMIERHYSAAIVDALGELAAAAVVPIASPTGNVTRLTPKRKQA